MSKLNTEIAEAEAVVDGMAMQNISSLSYSEKIKQRAKYYDAIDVLIALKRSKDFPQPITPPGEPIN